MLDAAAHGSFPPADGGVDVMPPDPDGWWAVVSFTGHAVVLADVDAEELGARGADGYGGATHPDVLRWLAERVTARTDECDNTIGSLDVLLLGRGAPGPVMPPRPDLDDHPRVQRAREHRREMTVDGDDTGLVIVGRGIVGRREIAVELLDPVTDGNAGRGRRLIRAGLARLAPGEPCWAQVAPGNAASLRAFLACGFVPVASEVLIGPAPDR